MLKSVFKTTVLTLFVLQTAGCASYYSHYGSFTAQTSAGDARLFVVSWRTEEYPDWALQDSNATAIVLKTQCSDREWQMVESSATKNACTESNQGIVACGSAGLDLTKAGKPITQANELCVSVSDENNSTSVIGLNKEILIKVDCLPQSTTLKVGDEVKNTDYLKASVVPYSVSTRKVSRNSFGDKPPFMSDKICDKPE